MEGYIAIIIHLGNIYASKNAITFGRFTETRNFLNVWVYGVNFSII